MPVLFFSRRSWARRANLLSSIGKFEPRVGLAQREGAAQADSQCRGCLRSLSTQFYTLLIASKHEKGHILGRSADTAVGVLGKPLWPLRITCSACCRQSMRF